jgi:hypothetical protein
MTFAAKILSVFLISSILHGADIRVLGIMESKKGGASTSFAVVSTDGKTASGWLKVGSTWNSYEIIEISSGNSLVIFKNAGKQIRVQLEPEKVRKETTASLGDPATPGHALKPEIINMNWTWIDSDKNPMRKGAIHLPKDVLFDWKNLTNEEKGSITDYYLKHGFILEVDYQKDFIHDTYRAIQNPNRKIDSRDFGKVNPLVPQQQTIKK